jgi:CheY-like chemotaxis protein
VQRKRFRQVLQLQETAQCNCPEGGMEGKSVMGSRILLADDSITIQKVVNLTFQDEGIEVVSVSNGDMAEKRLKEVDPDLVLADIFMPGKNGYELCESIKQNPDMRTVPVVLLVGAFEPFNEAEARRVHADAHLTKPFESRVLVETVRNLMDKHPKPKPAPVVTQARPEAVAYPNAPPLANPPFNLDPSLMGELPSQGFGNLDYAPLQSQPAHPQAAFSEPPPVANFNEPTPFTEAFPTDFENKSMQPPAFTINETPAVQNRFPTNPAADAVPATQFFGTTATDPAEASAEEMPIELNEPVNLNPELLNFYEQYDKSPAQPEKTQVLGSFAPQVETPNPTAFDLIVDFDKVETFEDARPDNILGVDVDGFSDSVKSDEPMVAQPIPTAGPTEEVRKFDTNELEPKGVQPASSLETREHTALTNGFSASHSTEFPSSSSVALSENSSSSEILATDEPLGDVLTNLPPFAAPVMVADGQSPLELDDPYFQPAAVSYAASPAPVDSFSEVAPVADTPLTEPQVKAEEAPVLLTATPEADKVFKEFDVTSQISPETAAEPEAEFPEAPALETHPAVEAFEVQAEPAMTAEPVAPPTLSPYNGLDKESSEAANPLAEFTPVNLEAVLPQISVNESAPHESVSEPSSESVNASQALPEAASVLELPSSKEAVNHQGGDMSQEMIDEIVRRVVAQLSDSVVREIAWEVVPDCVERVVNNLTREGMNNKLAN